MSETFRILFYKSGEPISPGCIERLIWAFPESYSVVVQSIIERSERLDEGVFRWNVARLMPSFGMTRAGAFHGVKLDKNGAVIDRTGVIDLCWKRVGDKLLKLKEYINENSRARNRALVTLTPHSQNYAFEKTSELFDELCEVVVKTSEFSTSQVSPVGASKVLFSTFPEIALPVDNREWEYVFKTKKYGDILSTMANEIKKWERKTGKHLETLNGDVGSRHVYSCLEVHARIT